MTIGSIGDVGLIGHLNGEDVLFNNAKVVILPVPWDVTVSYGKGTANAPRQVLNASAQIDTFYPSQFPNQRSKFHMLDIDKGWEETNRSLANDVYKLTKSFEIGKILELDSSNYKISETINRQSTKLNKWVEKKCDFLTGKEKNIVLLGGDHSTILGYLRSLSKNYSSISLLQIDAHMDLRPSYQSFIYSHASIMSHALKLQPITSLVQVGIRDFSETEYNITQKYSGRIKTFYDYDIQTNDTSWLTIVHDIIDSLDTNVYVSIDIDGLDPSLCPNTGTPVPGGLSYNQLLILINTLKKSGKKIIGADLVEVGDSQNNWDANVGARILYNLCDLLL